MKKTVRLLGVLLIALLLPMMFACTDKANDPNKKMETEDFDLGGRTVYIGHWSDLAPAEGTAMYEDYSALIKSLEEKYHCKIEFVHAGGDWSTWGNQILVTALSNEKIADTFWYTMENLVPQWVNAGILMPLDGVFDFNDKDVWNIPASEQYKLNGKHYAITSWPDALGHVILFNKRIVEENGITSESLYKLVEDGEWTWDKMVELAKKCTKNTEDSDPNNDTWGFGAYASACPSAEPFIYSNGTTPVKQDGNQKLTYNLDDPAAVEAIDFCHKLVYDYKVVNVKELSWGYSEGLWKKGKVAFFECPSWADLQGYKEMLENDEFGFLLLPKGPKAKDYVNAQSAAAGLFMQKDTPDAKAIAQIMAEIEKPYEWKTNIPNWRNYESFVSDKGSLNIIKMIAGRSVSIIGGNATWFRDNVLWNDWGIPGKIPAKTYVETNKAPSQKSFDDLWSAELTVPEEEPAQ